MPQMQHERRNNMASVTFNGTTKRFGEVTALDHLNLEIADKEFLVLVGPSGCGKTTALRCLAGLEEITEGEVIIGDRIVNDVAPKDRDIAMVFQSYALYPHMSVYDNMAFSLKFRKMDKEQIEKRVTEAAKILGIENLLSRKPKQLSGGQRQRVAVGRAIVREPKVFLFDEPLSNLDAKLRVQTRAQISKLHHQLQATFIYVTHDQVEAMTMATRIAVMNKGILQQLDTPKNLYDYPTNKFVAGFIGSPSMNFFNAWLTDEAGQLYIMNEVLKLAVPENRVERYRPYIGQKVVFGIRPEDIHNPLYQPSEVIPATVKARVDVQELMGHEIYLYLMSGSDEYVARVDPRSKYFIGEEIEIVFNMANIHLFKPAEDADKSIAI
jgi:multiple sugar transport system ATP-binding protein